MNKDTALDLSLEALEKLKRAFFKRASTAEEIEQGCDRGYEDYEAEFVEPALKAITAIKKARSSPAAKGWKLVPVNPTPEMLAAADQGDREYTLRNFGDVQTVMQGPEDHYVAMLDAAPEPPAPAQPVDGTQVSKVWWDGEKLMAKPIPLEDFYQPVQEPVHPPCNCGRKKHEMHLGWCAHAESKVEWAGVAQKARHRAYIEAEWLKLNPPPAQPAPVPLTGGRARDMPDCWVVIKDGRIIATHDEPCHHDGIQAVRYAPAAQPAPTVQEPKNCSLCGEDEPLTGACGGGRNNPKALCYTTPAQPAVPLTVEQIDKAAMKLAECMDYPWAQMPEQGKQSMRDHAKAIIEAAAPEKGQP